MIEVISELSVAGRNNQDFLYHNYNVAMNLYSITSFQLLIQSNFYSFLYNEGQMDISFKTQRKQVKMYQWDCNKVDKHTSHVSRSSEDRISISCCLSLALAPQNCTQSMSLVVVGLSPHTAQSERLPLNLIVLKVPFRPSKRRSFCEYDAMNEIKEGQ